MLFCCSGVFSYYHVSLKYQTVEALYAWLAFRPAHVAAVRARWRLRRQILDRRPTRAHSCQCGIWLFQRLVAVWRLAPGGVLDVLLLPVESLVASMASLQEKCHDYEISRRDLS